jgi:hypothetical protein
MLIVYICTVYIPLGSDISSESLVNIFRHLIQVDESSHEVFKWTRPPDMECSSQHRQELQGEPHAPIHVRTYPPIFFWVVLSLYIV